MRSLSENFCPNKVFWAQGVLSKIHLFCYFLFIYAWFLINNYFYSKFTNCKNKIRIKESFYNNLYLFNVNELSNFTIKIRLCFCFVAVVIFVYLHQKIRQWYANKICFVYLICEQTITHGTNKSGDFTIFCPFFQKGITLNVDGRMQQLLTWSTSLVELLRSWYYRRQSAVAAFNGDQIFSNICGRPRRTWTW